MWYFQVCRWQTAVKAESKLTEKSIKQAAVRRWTNRISKPTSARESPKIKTESKPWWSQTQGGESLLHKETVNVFILIQVSAMVKRVLHSKLRWLSGEVCAGGRRPRRPWLTVTVNHGRWSLASWVRKRNLKKNKKIEKEKKIIGLVKNRKYKKGKKKKKNVM